MTVNHLHLLQFRCQILFIQIVSSLFLLYILGAAILILALITSLWTIKNSLALHINLPIVKPPAQNLSVTFYCLLNNACNSYQFSRINLSLILE